MENITVYMSTYNGEKFIREQIESIIYQKNVELYLVIRDDGSTDSTLDIIQEYSLKYPNIFVYAGENLGYANSFLTVLKEKGGTDYYAFADQDDIWEEDKLICGINKIKNKNNILYASSLKAVDGNNNYVSMKKFPHFTSTVGSTLSRNRLAGCTMIFDKVVRDKIANDIDEIIKFNTFKYGHDGWVVLYTLIFGGEIELDENSYIHYRRHDTTVTNIGGGLKKRIKNELKGSLNNCDFRENISKFFLTRISIENKNYEVLDTVANYKRKIKLKWKLIVTSQINTGIKIVDIYNRFFLVIGKY